jgi:signal transduction histidine kinase
MLSPSGIRIVLFIFLLALAVGPRRLSAQFASKPSFQDLINQGTDFLGDRAFDSARFYLDAALREATESDDACKQAIANRSLADFFQKKDELDTAPVYAEAALQKARTCGDSTEIAKCLNQAGGLCFRKSQYEKALDYFLEASEIARRQGIPELNLRALFYSGQIYLNQAKFPEAIERLEEALTVFEKDKKDPRIGNFLVMLIRAYGQSADAQDTTKLIQGLAYYDKVRALPKKQLSAVQSRASRLYLAEYYVPVIGPDSALRLIEQVIEESNPGSRGQAYACKVQSQLQLQLEQGPAAIASARRSLAMAQKLGLTDIERSAWGALHEALAYSGDYREAYLALGRFKSLEDSLLTERMNTEVQDLQIQYKTEQILHQKQALDKENILLKRGTRLARLVALLLGSILLLGMWFYFRLRAKNEIIQAQKAKLERANEAQNRLFAIIAHDLRGPFVSFQGLTQKLRWLQKKGRTEDIEAVNDHIGKTAHRLNILLDNLLAWSVEQREGKPYKAEVVPLLEAIEKQQALFEPALESKNQYLELDVAGDATALVSPPVLATLLRNLFSNAIKFSPQESTIKVRAYDEGEQVVLKVMDEGPGVSDEVLHRIFELDPDKRQSGSEGEKGAGIGLSLCKELALASGGDLTVDANYEGGAAFDVRLPKGR